MESKIDWLTLTIRPERADITRDECLEMLCKRFVLDDLISKMESVGKRNFYAVNMHYDGITFSFADAEHFSEQGAAIAFSSSGLDYFVRYLATYNLSLVEWCRRWRGLCFEGYLSKCTRIDYALDDIATCFDKPVLTISKIKKALKRGEVRGKSRKYSIINDDCVVDETVKSVDGVSVCGTTINIGSRSSEIFCRIYDKFAEKVQKKEEYDKNINSWTRVEFEFKHSKAMSVFNFFLDCPPSGFAEFMRGVVNNYLCFIRRDDSNISRCSVKRWWVTFLRGCTMRFKLPHKLPARSAYARARRGLRQYTSIIYSMYQELGLDGMYDFFSAEVERKKEQNKEVIKPQLIEDIREERRSYEEMDAFKHYYYNSADYSDYDCWGVSESVFRKRIRSQVGEYDRKYFDEIVHQSDFDRLRHQMFLEGQEVLAV